MLEEMMGLVLPFRDSLVSGDIENCGKLLHQNWKLKKQLTLKIASSTIDEIYDAAISAGALGGKLLGAGGSGFMIFIVHPKFQKNVSAALNKLDRQHWRLENSGSTVIFNA